MSERPTPETDMSQHEGILKENSMPTQVVHVNFARKLERERDEWAAICGQYKHERDEARLLLKAAKSALDAIHLEVGGWIKIMNESTD